MERIGDKESKGKRLLVAPLAVIQRILEPARLKSDGVVAALVILFLKNFSHSRQKS
jgi:hypothetical protein